MELPGLFAEYHYSNFQENTQDSDICHYIT